jgi:hypothetical protein
VKSSVGLAAALLLPLVPGVRVFSARAIWPAYGGLGFTCASQSYAAREVLEA